MSGYSGTPLAKKLGIRAGDRVFLHAPPPNYAELVAPLPPDVLMPARAAAEADLLHVFAVKRALLATLLKQLRTRMRPDAALWVSWPKKASGVSTDITEDTIRALALPLGLVDIKVCAVDDTWSGLKLMVRRSERPARRAARRA